MRTIDEIQAQIDRLEGQCFDEHDQGEQGEAGELAGFRAALRLVKAGKARADILDFALADERSYHSWGDDYADAWQSGYSTALYWAAEQFDWDDTGRAIRRPDSIFPAETW